MSELQRANMSGGVSAVPHATPVHAPRCGAWCYWGAFNAMPIQTLSLRCLVLLGRIPFVALELLHGMLLIMFCLHVCVHGWCAVTRGGTHNEQGETAYRAVLQQNSPRAQHHCTRPPLRFAK